MTLVRKPQHLNIRYAQTHKERKSHQYHKNKHKIIKTWM